MSTTVSRVLVVAGALVPERWLPPGAIAQAAPGLAGLLDRLQPVRRPCPLPDGELRELAHDRYLRDALGLPVAAGAMTAVRAVAALPAVPDDSGWLLQPVGFHVARDHMVLDVDAAAGLQPDQAQALVNTIRPLLVDEGFELTMLDPRHWWLAPAAGPRAGPWQLDPVSLEIAAGRHVADWLPQGDDARRLRRLLNEIQMAWFAAREGFGPERADRDGNDTSTTAISPAINSVWLSGPVSPAAVAAWQSLQRDRQLQFDDRLLDARLHDEPHRWLETLDRIAPRWFPTPPGAGNNPSADADSPPLPAAPSAILLCGERHAVWLDLPPGASSGSAPARPGLGGLAHRLAGWLRPLARTPRGRRTAGKAEASHEQLFSEPAA